MPLFGFRKFISRQAFGVLGRVPCRILIFGDMMAANGPCGLGEFGIHDRQVFGRNDRKMMSFCRIGAGRWGAVDREVRTAGGRWMGAAVTRLQCRASGLDGCSPSVVVTRESGKNGKLMKALSAKGVSCLELPLIEHRTGRDFNKLSHTILDVEFEWIVVTSPEAASVFVDGWRDAGYPKVRIAVVGVGTGQVFEEIKEGREGLVIEFSPSKATAKVLAAELPKITTGNGRVLYPSSAKAGSDLEIGLSERGFEVMRLNTYSTESVKALDQEKVAAALAAPVATFASPTAVKAWVELMGPWSGAAACIGITSALAAKKAGLNKVYYPESPGIDGWVESVMEALNSQVHHPSVA